MAKKGEGFKRLPLKALSCSLKSENTLSKGPRGFQLFNGQQGFENV